MVHSIASLCMLVRTVFTRLTQISSAMAAWRKSSYRCTSNRFRCQPDLRNLSMRALRSSNLVVSFMVDLASMTGDNDEAIDSCAAVTGESKSCTFEAWVLTWLRRADRCSRYRETERSRIRSPDSMDLRIETGRESLAGTGGGGRAGRGMKEIFASILGEAGESLPDMVLYSSSKPRVGESGRMNGSSTMVRSDGRENETFFLIRFLGG
jgi:hypothetical protein